MQMRDVPNIPKERMVVPIQITTQRFNQALILFLPFHPFHQFIMKMRRNLIVGFGGLRLA